jgi:hypothetical protein
MCIAYAECMGATDRGASAFGRLVMPWAADVIFVGHRPAGRQGRDLALASALCVGGR